MREKEGVCVWYAFERERAKETAKQSPDISTLLFLVPLITRCSVLSTPICNLH